MLRYSKLYKQNNREKWNEYKRKSQQKQKNVKSDNNEGTSFVNPQTGDFTNKGKLPIVCEESFEEGNLPKEGEEECNKGVEEPNKIIEDERNPVDSKKKMHPFDLNEKPDDEECEDKGEDDEIEEEEPNSILENDTIDLNKKMHPFDLNEKPDNEGCEEY
uniref:Uncharacterized protein n=1 Tax=Meloidogyne incognita TaxID=6306 RepID=A0A914M3I6_MELIC